MPSNDLRFVAKNERIILWQGKIVNAETDIIVIPVSMNGSISSRSKEILALLEITAPELSPTKLGNIKFVSKPTSSSPQRKLKKGIIYATSEHDLTSTYTAIRTIGQNLADYANKNNIQSIAIPLSGARTRGLETERLFHILVAAFDEVVDEASTCSLAFFLHDETSWNTLAKVPLPTSSSLQQTFEAAILQNIKRDKWIKEIIDSKEFYFETAVQKFEDFLYYHPADITTEVFYQSILSVIEDGPVPFRELLGSYPPGALEYAFLEIMGKLIAHVDNNGYNKREWNENTDQRTIATNMNQHELVKGLLLFKIKGSLAALSTDVANIIRYLQDPEHELAMYPEAHRMLMLEFLFNTGYSDSKSLEIAFDFLGRYVNLNNPRNKGYLYSRLLYLPDIRSLWQGEMHWEGNGTANEEPDDSTYGSKIKPVIHSDLYARRDLLNHKIYAHAIVEFLKHPDTKPPLTIGILAPWGDGKTTMMHFVQEKLDSYNVSPTENTTPDEGMPAEGKKNALKHVVATYKDLQRWLKDKLHDVKVKRLKNPTVWFNAWKFRKSEEIWAGFAYEIIHQLVNKIPHELEREEFWLKLNLKRVDERKIKDQITFSLLNKIIARTWWVLLLLLISALTICLLMVPGLYTVTAIFGISFTSWLGIGGALYARFRGKQIDFDISRYVKQPEYEGKIGYFHQVESDLKYVLELLVDKNDPLVIFIDDLDRCPPKVVVDVVEAINLFISGDFPDCYFILGQDAQMVAALLDAAYKDMEPRVSNIRRGYGSLGWSFMEKFIQLQFNIPNISPAQCEIFLKVLFNQPAGASQVVEPVKTKKVLESPANSPANTKKDPALKCSELIKAIEVADIGTLSAYHTDIVAMETDPGFDVDMVVPVREIYIRKAASCFTDTDRDVAAIITAYSKYLPSPRAIKRFANLYRFYRFLQFAGQCNPLALVDSKVLCRWIILTIQWPQLVRCIQWDTEKDFLNGGSPEDRATIFEEELLKCDTFDRWKAFAKDTFIPWLNDKNLYDFVQGTQGEKGAFKEAVKVGFW